MAKTCILFTYLCFILLRGDLNICGWEKYGKLTRLCCSSVDVFEPVTWLKAMYWNISPIFLLYQWYNCAVLWVLCDREPFSTCELLLLWFLLWFTSCAWNITITVKICIYGSGIFWYVRMPQWVLGCFWLDIGRVLFCRPDNSGHNAKRIFSCWKKQ